MRRSLAGLLFGFACVFGSLALSSFWLQFTAFSPGHTRAAAGAVLEDSEIKNEVALVIANAVSAQLAGTGDITVSAPEIQKRVLAVANTGAGAEILSDIVADAHAKLIGATDEPVQITSEQLVQIVRDERASVVPTITLDVPTVTPLSVMREVLRWLVPIAAGLALVLVILGFAAHPERAELLRSLGFLLLGLGVMLLIVGYIVPTFVLPILTDNVWVNAVPRLAREALPLLIGMVFLLAGSGLGCLAAAAASKRRDRWSQPVRRTSYREERRWS